MDNKYEAIKRAVFYADEKPEEFAKILESFVSDVVTSVVPIDADSIEILKSVVDLGFSVNDDGEMCVTYEDE